MKVAHQFSGRWTSFFATTYTIEPEFFDEYLFRRLGDPPVNATLLVDGDAHARLWTDAASGGDIGRRLRRVNRDYLLRPIFFGNSTFHPKTYLFGNAREGRLLVGSGNLTLRGVERGHEVFAVFRSTEADDLGSVRGWRQWMDRLVQRLDDDEVTYRWHRVRTECAAWLEGDAAGSLFIGSDARGILDQFAEDINGPTDELHLMAPFYDRDAIAVRKLVDRFRPRRLHVYLGAQTSVSGTALTGVLSEVEGKVSVHEIEPPEFVHAKLIGVITGDHGRLLAGSANLSQAALMGAGQSWGNVEACVETHLTSGETREAFRPPHSEWRDVPLERVGQLVFQTESSSPRFAVHLRAARLERDGRVTAKTPDPIPAGAELTAGADGEPLIGATTRSPLRLPVQGGVLIWLRTADGDDLSNRVPLDDRTRLGSWLEEHGEGGYRPRELDSEDFETPVGRMLIRLHESSIFDIDETPALARAAGLTDREVDEQTTTWEELEELLAKEELARDPRVEHYRYAVPMGLPEDDDVLALLRLMLARTPAERALRLVGTSEESPTEQPGHDKPWTPIRRLQVRLFNVLQRWSLALADPRFVWIDPTSPVRNYAGLLVADSECWEQQYLPAERVVKLIGALLNSFIRTERSRGYLAGLPDDERRLALNRLPEEARALGAALVYCSLRPGPRVPDYLFEWQPALVDGLKLGVFEVTVQTSDVVERLIGDRRTPEEIGDRLEWAATYVDDERWEARQERDLGFGRVRLTNDEVSADFGVTLDVAGDHASLNDPAIIPLVRQALAYRKTDGAIVSIGNHTRLSVKLGEEVWARIDSKLQCSATPVDLETLVELECRGVSFQQVLVPAEEVAS